MYDGTRIRQMRPTPMPLLGGILQRSHSPLHNHNVCSNGLESEGVPPIVHDVLRSSGEPLDYTTRAFMEPRFGHDFSNVRVHTDERAATSARAIQAVSYTAGSHLVFDKGAYSPSTGSGRMLLGHELAHSIQQSAFDAPGFNDQVLRFPRVRASVPDLSSSYLRIGSAHTPAELEAAHIGRNIQSITSSHNFTSSGPLIQRQAEQRPAQISRPEDFGITLVVVDHGATGVVGAARSRLDEVYRSLQPANLRQLQSSGVTRVEMHIIPYDQKLVDLSEFADLRGVVTPDGRRRYDDLRGVGGRRTGSTIRYAVAEENLSGSRHGHGWAIGLGIVGGLAVGAGGAALGVELGQRAQGGSSGSGGLIGGIVGGVVGAAVGGIGLGLLGNLADEPNGGGYARDFTASHEGTHTVEQFALTPTQRTTLQALYNARKAANGPWLAPADFTSS
ncbi:MAG: eCIS core domain-containing protein, partial [Pyrinomonadaceae bacterium]